MYTLFVFSPAPSTQLYTLSLHDALPIWLHQPRDRRGARHQRQDRQRPRLAHPAQTRGAQQARGRRDHRSEEHTSELQSQFQLVCRLLLEKKNASPTISTTTMTSRIA